MRPRGFEGRSRRRHARAVLAAGVLAIVALACASDAPPLPEQPAAPDKAAYVIGAGDVLRISVWKNPELGVQAPVRPDGKISVPLVDDLHAEGLTALELKQVITRELEEYISNPDVTVVVNETRSKRAYVIGAVGRSGPVPLSTDMRVLDAISMMGGFTPFADKSEIKIIRHTENGEEEYAFDYDAYVSGEAPGTNLRLRPGDTIVVPD